MHDDAACAGSARAPTTRSGRTPYSLRDDKIFKPAFVRGHRQVTDIYLLGLAVKMGGCLATLDRTIPLGAVVGAAPDRLQIVAPAEHDG